MCTAYLVICREDNAKPKWCIPVQLGLHTFSGVALMLLVASEGLCCRLLQAQQQGSFAASVWVVHIPVPACGRVFWGYGWCKCTLGGSLGSDLYCLTGWRC